MKYVLAILWVCSSIALSAQEKETKEERKATVAVLDFTVISGLSPQDAAALTAKFRSSIIQTKKYTILERSDMESILKEQDFTMTDMCNTAECAVEVGQLLAAEKMITGDIGKIGETYTVTVRLIDVTTSQVELTESAEYKGPADGLIKTFDLLAQKLTGIYRKTNTLLYVLGGAAIAGGAAAAVLLLGGGGGGSSNTVGTPPGTPQ